MNKPLQIALALFLWATPAMAQVTPVIFERSDISIDSPIPQIQDEQPNAKSNTPRSTHPTLKFNIEVRPEDALRLEYIHTMNSLTGTTGVMIAFTAPNLVSLPMFKVPTPVDALFVADNGQVIQILPNVVLEQLEQDVVAPVPVKAFLFLKAGTVAALNIRPQDIITGKQFTASPPLME